MKHGVWFPLLARTYSLVLACGDFHCNGIFTLRTNLTSMNHFYARDLFFAMGLVLAFLNVLEIEICLESGEGSCVPIF